VSVKHKLSLIDSTVSFQAFKPENKKHAWMGKCYTMETGE